MTDKEKLDAIRAEIHRIVAVRGYDREMANDLFTFIESLPNESVSEELKKAAEQDVCEVVNTCSATGIPNDHIPSWVQDAMINEFIHGANWQKEQFKKDYTNLCNGIATAKGLAVAMAYDKGVADTKEQMKAKAIDATIGLPYENKDGGYTHLIDVSRPLPVGNNKIAIIFKED